MRSHEGAPRLTNADKDSRNASLAVIFYPAGAGKTPKHEVLGSLLTNPGGPGGSGFEFIARQNAAKNNELLAANFDTILVTSTTLSRSTLVVSVVLSPVWTAEQHREELRPSYRGWLVRRPLLASRCAQQ